MVAKHGPGEAGLGRAEAGGEVLQALGGIGLFTGVLADYAVQQGFTAALAIGRGVGERLGQGRAQGGGQAAGVADLVVGQQAAHAPPSGIGGQSALGGELFEQAVAAFGLAAEFGQHFLGGILIFLPGQRGIAAGFFIAVGGFQVAVLPNKLLPLAVAAELFEPLVAQAVGHGAGLGLGEELGGLAGIALFERGLGGLEELVVGQYFFFGIAAAAAGQLDGGGAAVCIDGLDRGFGLA